MPGPYDYSLNVESPFEAALGGLKLGATMSDIRARQQALKLQEQQRQAALEQAQRQEAERRHFLSLDRPTSRDVLRYASGLSKDQADAIRPYIENMDKETQRGHLNFGMQVMSALETNPAVGVKLMRERAQGARNSGDEQNAKAYDTIADMAEQAGPGAAMKVVAPMVLALPGGKEAIEGIVKTREEGRATEEFPVKQEKAKTELEESKQKVKTATATAIIREAEANLAPERLFAELGLTKAQTTQAKAAAAASGASAAKSSAEARRIAAEAAQIGSGVIPADKRPEAEAKFRKEYSEQTKTHQDVKAAYGRVLSSDNSAVGDLSLIFGYMKMLDPGSVVREGEFANAQNAAGVPDRLINVYNKVLSGERLNDGQRSAFKGQAKNLFESSKEQEGKVRSGIGRIAKGYGLNTENIFYESQESEPTAKTGGSVATPSKQTSVTVSAGGKSFTFPNQEAADAFKRAAGVK